MCIICATRLKPTTRFPNTITHTHSHTDTHRHSHTLTHRHSHRDTHTQSLTHTHNHSHTLTHTHTLCWRHTEEVSGDDKPECLKRKHSHLKHLSSRLGDNLEEDGDRYEEIIERFADVEHEVSVYSSLIHQLGPDQGELCTQLLEDGKCLVLKVHSSPHTHTHTPLSLVLRLCSGGGGVGSL